MLLSMTGFGSAELRRGDLTVSVEIRAVNNRHLKVTVRGSDPYPLMESEVEKVVRRRIRRGTVLLQIRVDRPSRQGVHQLDAGVLKSYLTQLVAVVRDSGNPTLLAPLAAGALGLPGVVPQSSAAVSRPAEDEWSAVEEAIEAALEKLNDARRLEGDAMASELLAHQAALTARLADVTEHLPQALVDYRARLLGRVRQAIADAGVTLEPEHLVREVTLFADRTDVAEEVHRLTAHLAQFEEIVRTESDSAGRRLEFVAQEMGREVNTLGSKAGDSTLSNCVFEMKVTLDKIRELVQNAE